MPQNHCEGLMPIKKRRKLRIVADEDSAGYSFKDLKKVAKVITSTDLMGRSGAKDIEILEKCSAEDYHILTSNVSDFRPLQRSNPHLKAGVIGITGTSRNDSIKNFTQHVTKTKAGHEEFYRKSVEVSSSKIIIKDSKSSKKTIDITKKK